MNKYQNIRHIFLRTTRRQNRSAYRLNPWDVFVLLIIVMQEEEQHVFMTSTVLSIPGRHHKRVWVETLKRQRRIAAAAIPKHTHQNKTSCKKQHTHQHSQQFTPGHKSTIKKKNASVDKLTSPRWQRLLHVPYLPYLPRDRRRYDTLPQTTNTCSPHATLPQTTSAAHHGTKSHLPTPSFLYTNTVLPYHTC